MKPNRNSDMVPEIRHSFKDHLATRDEKTIRWADPKTITRAVEFTLSGRTLLVTGDFGVAGYQTSGPQSFESWGASHFDYWAEKCCASGTGGGREWNAELAEHRVRDIPKEMGFGKHDTLKFNESEAWFNSGTQEDWEAWLNDRGDDFELEFSDHCEIGIDIAYNVIVHVTALRMALEQLGCSIPDVHWIPQCVSFEDWGDEPCKSPVDAAERLFRDEDFSDEIWDNKHELIREGKTTINLHGCVRTTDPLEGDQQFDGYEPGSEYWKRNDQYRVVTITTSFQVGPAIDGDSKVANDGACQLDPEASSSSSETSTG
jgi:hypothetical protein